MMKLRLVPVRKHRPFNGWVQINSSNVSQCLIEFIEILKKLCIACIKRRCHKKTCSISIDVFFIMLK